MSTSSDSVRRRVSRLVLGWLAGLALTSGCVTHSSGPVIGGVTYGAGPNIGHLHAETVRTETVKVELDSDDLLDLSSTCGSIKVTASTDDAPQVVATFRVRARSTEEAQAVLDRYHLHTESGGGCVTVRVEGTPLELHEGLRRYRLAPTVDFHATVAPGVRLRLRTPGGSIAVTGPVGPCEAATHFGDVALADVTGDVRASSSSGNVSLERASGQVVELTTAFGGVRAGAVKADRLKAHTDSGSVRIRSFSGGGLDVRSSFGEIILSSVEGAVNAHTSSGTVTLTEAQGASATLSTDFGAIRVRRAEGTLSARTSSGHVEVRDFDGRVDARTSFGGVTVEGVLSAVSARSSSGGITVRAKPGSRADQTWTLGTSFGAVRLDLPDPFDCHLYANTDFGRIDARGFAVVNVSKDGSGAKLRGTIGAGGPTVTLESSSGSIHIAKAQAEKPS